MTSKSVCRTCLNENTSTVSILDMPSSSFIISIKDMLMECTSINISVTDALPKAICGKCLEVLRLAYNFIVMCKKSENILLSLDESKVPIDLTDHAQLETSKIDLKAGVQIDNSRTEIDAKSREINIRPVKSKRCCKLRKNLSPSGLKSMKKIKPENKIKTGKTRNDKLYHCVECNVSFAIKPSLYRHNREKHLTFKYECDICKKRFMHHKVYFKHQLQHGFSCKICYQVYDKQSDLDKHSVCHQNQSKFICKECGKEFEEATKLFAHYRRHAENNNTHLCTICGKVVTRADSLRKHMKSHEDMPFNCKICGKKYRLKASWKYHMMSHDPNTKYTYVVCNICGKLFKTKSNLRKHSILHVENRVKKHACTYCDKRFDRCGDLKTHMRIHTGEKPYSCSMCDMKFTQSNLLKNHLKLHSHIKT